MDQHAKSLLPKDPVGVAELEKAMAAKRSRSRMIAGFVTLAFMIASWVAMSEFLANLQADYPKPFFITW